MIITVNSNIVSGLYLVAFEVLLPILLAFALQKLNAVHNLRALHTGQQHVRLTTTRLSCIADYGFATAKRARFLSLVGASIFLLTIAGSFSIDGRSREKSTLRTAEYLITPAVDPDDLIDFTKHVAPSGASVSPTFLLARDASRCYTIEKLTRTLVSAVASYDGDLNAMSSEIGDLASNVLCMYESRGYVNGDSFVSEHAIDYSSVSLAGCRYSISPRPINNSIWKENATFTCDHIEAMETWCAKFTNYVCVTQARLDVGFSFKWEILESVLPILSNDFGESYTVKAAHTKILQHMAYLVATGVEHDLIATRHMSRLSIKRNALVEKRSGELLFETELLLWLFITTTGVATLATVVICICALVQWRQIVVRHGLQTTNNVSGAMDVMLLAASIGCNEDKEVRANDGVVVAVSCGQPRVGPCALTEIGNGDFREHDVQGRLRPRRGGQVLALHYNRATKYQRNED